MIPVKDKGGRAAWGRERFRPQCRSGSVIPMGSSGAPHWAEMARPWVPCWLRHWLGLPGKNMVLVQKVTRILKVPQLEAISSLLSSHLKGDRVPLPQLPQVSTVCQALGGAFTWMDAVSDLEQPDNSNIVVPI